MEEIVIRDYIPFSDDAFIFDSWMKSYYGQSSATVFLPRKEFQDKHSKLISKILNKSTIKIASQKDDSDIIVGYIVYETTLAIHYVYVKEDFRGFGICKMLLAESHCKEGSRCTHLTMKARSIAQKRGYIYSPYFDL